MKRVRATFWAVLGIGLAVVLVAGGVVLWSNYNKSPLPIQDRCIATAGGRSTTVDPEQARIAAIIAGTSVRRGLVPRAASIGIATAYQESGIRNLDHGHADSVGVFQQRPSMGWGTVAEIMDPWYSSREFYRAMERVDGWQTRDINDVAQAVQRSAYPEAYRRHVPNARTLASSLTGETPASFTCAIGTPPEADPKGMARFLAKTLGETVSTEVSGATVLVRAKTTERAWAVAHLAIATTADYGLSGVQVGSYGWTHSRGGPAAWQGTGPSRATEVKLVFPEPAQR